MIGRSSKHNMEDRQREGEERRAEERKSNEERVQNECWTASKKKRGSEKAKELKRDRTKQKERDCR